MISQISFNRPVIQQNNYARQTLKQQANITSSCDPSFTGVSSKRLGVGGMALLATLFAGCERYKPANMIDVSQKFGSELVQKMSDISTIQKQAITQGFQKAGNVIIKTDKANLNSKSIDKIAEQTNAICRENYPKAVVGSHISGYIPIQMPIGTNGSTMLIMQPIVENDYQAYREVKPVITNLLEKNGKNGTEYAIETDCYGKL